ncbi:hypothetical protein LRAMOSA08174 [Lichtheimia ramosa]|uniref:BZIP domain-containing protein n=1 Tax=Lichtheimia ramosa TaxID=688394 RepID=A0A077WDA2_9FUNG|nr:hypothetical protein LRAMOSA08174 [Lichtheimia ramosa]
MSCSSPRVKTEPEIQQEDELLMSYLNADCVSNNSPWSSPSSKVTDLQPCTPPGFIDGWSLTAPGVVSGSSVMMAPSHSSHPVPNTLPTHEGYYPAISASSDPLSYSYGMATPSAHPSSVLSFLESFGRQFGGTTTPTSSQYHLQQPPSPASTATSSSCVSSPGNGEQPKRKRGRKKRDSSVSLVTSTPVIAPAPAISSTPCATTSTGIKKEMDTNPQHNMIDMKQRATTTTPASSPEEKAAAALAKRQERLIKNRAAALLSRKRKREHLNALEEQNQSLKAENEELKLRLSVLENQGASNTAGGFPSMLTDNDQDQQQPTAAMLMMVKIVAREHDGNKKTDDGFG